MFNKNWLSRVTVTGCFLLLFSACGNNTSIRSSFSIKPASYEIPEENRFEVTVLDEHLNEPVDLAVMKDGSERILYIERKGAIKLYDPAQNKSIKIGQTDLYIEDRGEGGLMGIALDPDFDQNRWVYLYYSPAGDKAVHHLVRVDFEEGSLNMATEKLILEVGVQREACCHTAGAIEFGPDGNLYLATGDDNNHFHSDGFGPMDERPGRSAWDAQGTSGNTNDLRGKILRITPQADGSYSIPEANLFAPDDELARPETYVMGTRNPYRMSIDHKTGYLYWGDIGPDAGEDDEMRGPMGYDEINQAKEAGFYGWPFIIADNQPYRDFNFEDSISGDYFDVEGVMNTSPNNTGLTKLPPARKAFIWYPYGDSPEFPMVGKGGRSAMAGPVFYNDLYEKTDHTFPDYFDGKLFIYDWMRGWVKIVTVNVEGDLEKIDPFMPGYDFTRPIDMEFGPKGNLYVLAYGASWLTQNEDAKLLRIDYNRGNRKPVVQFSADKTAGAAPLTVHFSSEGSRDPDGDKLLYEWNFTDDLSNQSNEQHPVFTYSKPGVYMTSLTVTDTQGEYATKTMEVKVGNEPAVVTFDLNANRSFFWDTPALEYSVQVFDKEDGSLVDGNIEPDDVIVTIDYLPEGQEIDLNPDASEPFIEFPLGRSLIAANDCKACHQLESISIGPSYREVALQYKGDHEAVENLAQRIIEGGSGVWGTNAMSAHPQLAEEDAREMVHYILSLSDKKVRQSLPLSGRYLLNDHENNARAKGSYLLRAVYTDKGTNEIDPIASQATVFLKYPEVKAVEADKTENVLMFQMIGREYLEVKDGSYIAYEHIDLTGIGAITIRGEAGEYGGVIEIRTGSEPGELIGETELKPADGTFELKIEIKKKKGFHDLFLIIKNTDVKNQPLFMVDELYFHQTD